MEPKGRKAENPEGFLAAGEGERREAGTRFRGKLRRIAQRNRQTERKTQRTEMDLSGYCSKNERSSIFSVKRRFTAFLLRNGTAVAAESLRRAGTGRSGRRNLIVEIDVRAGIDLPQMWVPGINGIVAPAIIPLPRGLPFKLPPGPPLHPASKPKIAQKTDGKEYYRPKDECLLIT
jgi:hypothetical protein